MELAEAHYIHVAYKTVERALKSRDYATYKEQIDDLYCKIKHYRLRQAYNNLSRKQFVGFLLMKLSPKAYILVCKVMKIQGNSDKTIRAVGERFPPSKCLEK